jgi:ribosomal protein S18 acetylase RimI-like enzyme
VNELPFINLRQDLTAEARSPSWPTGIRSETFNLDHDAQEAHAVLVMAYAKGGGSVEPFSVWWPNLSSDPEFDATLFFIAVDTQRGIVGVAQCWTSAFIKDLAVAPNWRRRGIGEALLLHAFACFRHRGAQYVDLKVQVDNPSGAARLYHRVGMRSVAEMPSCGTSAHFPY